MKTVIVSVLAGVMIMCGVSVAAGPCVIVSTPTCEIMQCCGPEFDECECLT